MGGPKVIRNHAGRDGITLNLITAVGMYSVSLDKIGLFSSLKKMMQWFIPFVFKLSSKFCLNRCVCERDVILVQHLGEV